jgi:signal transduction histidine kinase
MSLPIELSHHSPTPEVRVRALAAGSRATARIPVSVARDAGGLTELDAAIRADRDRIARDLHDTVIQRIFAAAMSVHALRAKPAYHLPDAELAHVVKELDRSIAEIRSVIYRLSPDEHSCGLESELLAVIDEERPALGLTPAVRFSGDLGRVDRERRHHVLAILRELLSNVARHAHATSVDIDIAVADTMVVRVGDNGVGFDPVQLRSGRGIRNARQRAGALGGSLSIRRRPGGGTLVKWLVPLPD